MTDAGIPFGTAQLAFDNKYLTKYTVTTKFERLDLPWLTLRVVIIRAIIQM